MNERRKTFWTVGFILLSITGPCGTPFSSLGPELCFEAHLRAGLLSEVL